MQGHDILVTGGAGFLGLHLCEKLLKDRHKVTILDNFQTGSTKKIGHLSSSPNLQLMRQSVTDPIIGEFSHIYNLALPASPPQYQKDPIGTFKTNVLGTLNVLEYALASGAAVLQASTSAVYGDPLVHPQPETSSDLPQLLRGVDGSSRGIGGRILASHSRNDQELPQMANSRP